MELTQEQIAKAVVQDYYNNVNQALLEQNKDLNPLVVNEISAELLRGVCGRVTNRLHESTDPDPKRLREYQIEVKYVAEQKSIDFHVSGPVLPITSVPTFSVKG